MPLTSSAAARTSGPGSWPCSNGTPIALERILDPMREGGVRLEAVLEGMVVEIDDPDRLADALPQLARPVTLESALEPAPRVCAVYRCGRPGGVPWGRA